MWILILPQGTDYLNVAKYSHFINSIITLILLIAIFIKIKRTDLFIFKKVDYKFCFLALFLGVLFVYFQAILNIIYFQKASTEYFQFQFSLVHLTKLSVLTSIIIVPITEELFFRNFLQRELSKKYKSLQSIIIASLMFAIIHLPFLYLITDYGKFDSHQAYIAFFGGILSGYLLYKTRSIIPSIIFHIFWNLTAWIV